MGVCAAMCSGKKKHNILNNPHPIATGKNIDLECKKLWSSLTPKASINAEDLLKLYEKIGIMNESVAEFYLAFILDLKELAVVEYSELLTYMKK